MFLPVRPLTADDLATLTEKVRRRVIHWFTRLGFLDADAAADMLAWKKSGFSVDASVRITLNDRDASRQEASSPGNPSATPTRSVPRPRSPPVYPSLALRASWGQPGRDEGDETDVAAAGGALEGKVLPDPRHDPHMLTGDSAAGQEPKLLAVTEGSPVRHLRESTSRGASRLLRQLRP